MSCFSKFVDPHILVKPNVKAAKCVGIFIAGISLHSFMLLEWSVTITLEI